jgi:hypothetical protein
MSPCSEVPICWPQDDRSWSAVTVCMKYVFKIIHYNVLCMYKWALKYTNTGSSMDKFKAVYPTRDSLQFCATECVSELLAFI